MKIALLILAGFAIFTFFYVKKFGSRMIESSTEETNEEIEDVEKRESYYKIKKSRNGKFYYVLVSANNKILNKSQLYDTYDICMGGIKACRNAADTYIVIDEE